MKRSKEIAELRSVYSYELRVTSKSNQKKIHDSPRNDRQKQCAGDLYARMLVKCKKLFRTVVVSSR